MISYPNYIQDHQTVLKLREVIDSLNKASDQSKTNTAAIAALSNRLTLPNIQQQLQAGGSNPLNINNLQGTASSMQSSASSGTHAQRLLTTPKLGTFWWETDRTVLYSAVTVSGSATWVYVAGTMQSTFANRPTDLGTNDASFSLYVTSGTSAVVYGHGFIWSGSAWLWDGDRAGIFVDAAINPGAGYQVCDGSATTYLTVGADLSEVSFTTPNEASGAAVYHGSAASYTGTLTAAVAPTFSGNSVTPTGSFTGTPGTTGNDSDAGITFLPSGVGSDAAVNPHTHPFTPAGSIAINPVTPSGTISLSGGDPVRNLGVLRYFRR